MSAAAYCALSVSVSLLNAHVVTFLPSVTPLLAAQAASTSLALALASRVGPREVCVGACREFPLALAFSAALWTRMEANRHASQSTILVARHLVPLVILPMERVVLGRRAPAELAAPLVAVALGAFAFARGARPDDEEYSSPRGFGGVVLAAHVLVTAAQLVMAKASVGDENGENGGGRRKRAAYAAGVNAAMALVFLAASALRRRSAFYFWSTDVTTMTSARVFATLATIPLSIVIVHVQTETQAKSSAAGFAALNNAAKAFSVVGSVAIGERAPTSASLIGLVATFVGGLWYARVSARLKARPEALVPKKEKKKRS